MFSLLRQLKRWDFWVVVLMLRRGGQQYTGNSTGTYIHTYIPRTATVTRLHRDEKAIIPLCVAYLALGRASWIRVQRQDRSFIRCCALFAQQMPHLGIIRYCALFTQQLPDQFREAMWAHRFEHGKTCTTSEYYWKPYTTVPVANRHTSSAMCQPVGALKPSDS